MTHNGTRRSVVVVTGAAGFIGSTLCERLLDAGHQVRGIDCLTTTYEPARKRANLAALSGHTRFELIERDLNAPGLDELLDEAIAIAHLAGEPGVSTSWGDDFTRYVERNVRATKALLAAAARCDVGRVVYASSSSVYGRDVHGPVPESTMPRPASPYGVTKLAAEHLVGAYAALGLPAISLRYFSVFGPRQRPDMAVHRFIAAILDGRPLTVYGDGGQVRDLTYVDDVVAATMAALTAPVESGAVLNVAGGNPVSVAELVRRVTRLMGGDAPAVEYAPERHGDVPRTNGATDAARCQLGWAPAVGLDDGLAHQIDWHVAQRRAALRTATRAPCDVPPSSGPRMLIYSQDGRGLGHLRRASSIAAAYLERGAGGAVLTVSDSPVGTLLQGLPNHDYVKLPSIVKSGPGSWDALTLPLDFAEMHELRSRVLVDAVTAFRPDVVLVDHMPHGAMGEIVPALEALRGRSTRIVLGLRDIIDAPEVVHERWHAEGAFDVLEQHYDQVLVYGSPDVFDVAAEYGWSPSMGEMARYCGYLCTPGAPDDDAKRIRSRRLADLPDGRLIVAMAGGGADAYELMSCLLDAFGSVYRERRCALVMVTGPFMPEPLRRELKSRADGQRVRVRTTVSDPVSYAGAADLAVAMAGYNTTTELLRSRTPALLVPRRGPSQEQRMRARRFAELGWVSQLDPDDLTPERLADAMLAGLDAGTGAESAIGPDLGGLERAVAHLRGTVLDLTDSTNGPPARVGGAAPSALLSR